MTKDAQEAALAEVRKAQADVEDQQAELEKVRETRHKVFERAKKTGLSLTEIGEAANLHRSRVDQILHGK